MGKAKLLVALTHIAGLAIFLSLPIFFIANQSRFANIWQTIFSVNTLQFIGIYIFIFYFHTYVLIPKLYRRKRLVLYFILLGLLLGAIIFIKPFDGMMHNTRGNFGENRARFNNGRFRQPYSMGERPEDLPGDVDDSSGHGQGNGRFQPPPSGDGEAPALTPGDRPGFGPPGPPQGAGGVRNPGSRLDIISIYLFAMTLAFSLSIEFRQRLREAEQRALKADADKANAELFFLKAQINPHFLFNTLNNIYSLAAVKSDKTAESILKLSNIMRYVTEDVTDNFVPLENELAFMTDYIDLQRMRLGKKMKISFEMPGDTSGKSIAPLILMTFVENAFKYGLSSHTDAEISIHLITHEYSIEFFCQNRIFDKPSVPHAGTGIGIRNTRARLEHLYAGKHILDIGQADGLFTVKLILQV